MRSISQNRTSVSLSKYEFRKEFHDFCKSTTLHGYHYLCDNENSITMKLTWAFVIIAMTIVGVTCFVINTQQFLDQKIVTTVESFSAPLSVR